jgi:hypothetical protein
LVTGSVAVADGAVVVVPTSPTKASRSLAMNRFKRWLRTRGALGT